MSDEPKQPETEPGKAADSASGAGRMPLPPMNFSTFIFSLNHTALMHLGVVKDPSVGETAKNLDLAKQTIDILAMLEEKTQGNLTDDESQMVKSILYDLRMIYVRERK
jgi:hypothetical protein